MIGWARRLRKQLDEFRRGRDAVSAVEFSCIAVPFFVLLFAILETGYVFLLAILLEGAVADGARQIRTGIVRGNAAGFETVVCNGMQALLPCSRINFDADEFATFGAIAMPGSPPTAKGTLFNNGTSGDIVVVRAAIQWTYMTPFIENMIGAGAKNLMATAVVLNE